MEDLVETVRQFISYVDACLDLDGVVCSYADRMRAALPERRSETPGAADPGRPVDTMVRDILDPFRRLV